ncbi:hypothetical protein HNQ07_002165 [Deinococcus metalli]|uniref:Uncharacterized protein n=1 Tax=Deinococcus metalli TaxID=1141878 RepID=A0A7W8NPE2_9DEIO|nr:hypothetical protein [Deinococcus metalli]MBB5376701.1 hypothetical protein [Deinococcus metalli]GHF65791.1 hypothetical protein GCM10017781_46890 [Deinococcus metalli]
MAVQAQAWRVVIRWADGEEERFVYHGPMWVGRASQSVHLLAQSAYARRRSERPELPTWQGYQVRSFTPIRSPVGGCPA